MSLSLAAIVLAGGRSSRMGQDKALIPVQGVPLLRQVCLVALECTSSVFVVTPWIDRYRPIVPPDCHLIQESLPPNDALPHGPLVGFAQALAQVQADWVLLLACDLPRLDAAILQAALPELPHLQTEIALLPRTEKGWEPLCGFYRSTCLTSLNAAISQGERSFQGWLAQESVRELPVTNPNLFFNCNTPADLNQLSDLS